MVEAAEIFRLHGPEYLAKYGERMPRAHLRAMRDIQQCRTPVLGGQGYVCPKCDERRYSYHSCKNRHCPKCGNDQATKWLEEQTELLLPVRHFLVTFTLPEELRRIARSNQKTVYNILFRASSEALQKLAWDERFVGGRVGMVGVLHTWTRALIYHPHVHYIVTSGGLSVKGEWKRSREDFLVPVPALSLIFRA
jgi:ribosomal protein L37AE/L43A